MAPAESLGLRNRLRDPVQASPRRTILKNSRDFENRRSDYAGQVRTLRDRLHEAIRSEISDAVLNRHSEERLPNTLNISFPGIDSSELQPLISERVACSTGCGCHGRKTAPSATLLAIGRSEALAIAALRLTLGVETTEVEIGEAASVITGGVRQLREKTFKAAH
jgi:cysteine sulfinate desulfinase/cysteine desulfurase-like protein